MKPSEMLRDENFECDEEMLDMVAKEVEQLEEGSLLRTLGAIAWLIDSHYIRTGPEDGCKCDVCKQWTILVEGLAEVADALKESE